MIETDAAERHAEAETPGLLARTLDRALVIDPEGSKRRALKVLRGRPYEADARKTASRLVNSYSWKAGGAGFVTGVESNPLIAVPAALGDMSVHQVWRELRALGISLARRRSWCVSADPEFEPKAANIVALYLQPTDNAVVISVNRSHTRSGLARFFLCVCAQEVAADGRFLFRFSGLTPPIQSPKARSAAPENDPAPKSQSPTIRSSARAPNPPRNSPPRQVEAPCGAAGTACPGARPRR